MREAYLLLLKRMHYVKGLSTSKTEDICQYIWDISEQFALWGAECGKIARSDLCRGMSRKGRIYSPGTIGVLTPTSCLYKINSSPQSRFLC